MFHLEPLPRTLEAARRDVRHRKVAVRMSAIRDLGLLAERGESAAVELLRVALRDDEVADVRAEAALALADAGSVETIGDLLEATSDAHLRTRQLAVLALGELAPEADPATRERVSIALGALLEAEAPALRYQALIGWCRLAGESAWPALRRALADPDGEVRHVALRLAEERWISGDEPPEEARQICRAALDDPDARVRVAGAVILARSGDATGRAVLVAAVAPRAAGDPEDIATAIELVGELGLTEAAGGLARRAFSVLGFSADPLAWQARIALARLGDARARASIIEGLSAWSRETRSLAAVAAGRARLAEARPLIEALQREDRAESSAIDEALRALTHRD